MKYSKYNVVIVSAFISSTLLIYSCSKEKFAEYNTNPDAVIAIAPEPLFTKAVTNMADVAAEIMERNSLTADDVAWLVPHQANKRIIDATANRMGVTTDKVMINIERYGNTTNGTIPLCLWEWESRLKKGDNIVLAAFGGGFTWGSVYLKWAYDTN